MSYAIHLHIQIHEKALELSRRYKKTESELIEILEQVENHKVYLHQGHSSLFQYGVQSLELSESVVYNLIAVMRKTKEVPALRTEIQNGNITLSNARKIAPVITPENQDEWLKKASELSQRELEKEVIKIRPQSAVAEKASYVTESRVKLEVGLFEKDMMSLRRVQDLVSQSRSAHASLEDTLIEMTQFYLKHKDPVIKAKRVFVKKGFSKKAAPKAHVRAASVDTSVSNSKNTETPAGHASTRSTSPDHTSSLDHTSAQNSDQPVAIQESNPRTPIPMAILHQVNLRDQRRCMHVNDAGKRCDQSRWIEIHHKKPVSEGGEHTLENLITLCSTHHHWVHSSA